jgi:hypothetical protein
MEGKHSVNISQYYDILSYNSFPKVPYILLLGDKDTNTNINAIKK